MNSRHIQLLRLLQERRRQSVRDLSNALDVSEVTIRKDLATLESRDLLRREHGYAVMESSDDIRHRLASNYGRKQEIAMAASSLVRDGMTIMIESGSCCALLAEELARTKRALTIITNSAFIAAHIREYPETKVVLLGGDYQPESQVVVGPLTRNSVQGFTVPLLFAGTDGFDPAHGFFGRNLQRTETVRAMAAQAAQTILLTESHKFEQIGVVRQFALAEVHQVFTDDGISRQTLSLLVAGGVKVHAIDVSSEEVSL